MEVNKLYKVKPQNYRGNTDPSAVILLKGTVSIGLIGRQALPAAQADMINLLNGDAIEVAGAYSFELLTRYICFTGSADGIELINYDIEDLGAIA